MKPQRARAVVEAERVTGGKLPEPGRPPASAESQTSSFKHPSSSDGIRREAAGRSRWGGAHPHPGPRLGGSWHGVLALSQE